MSGIGQVSKAFEFHIVSSIELKVYSVYITVIAHSSDNLYSVDLYSVESSLCAAVNHCIRQSESVDTVLIEYQVWPI